MRRNALFVGLCAIVALWLLRFGLILPVAIVILCGALSVIAVSLEQDSALKRYLAKGGHILMSAAVAIIVMVAVNRLFRIKVLDEMLISFGFLDGSPNILVLITEFFLVIVAGTFGYLVVYDNALKYKCRKVLAVVILIVLAVLVWQIKQPNLGLSEASTVQWLSVKIKNLNKEAGQTAKDEEALSSLEWGIAKNYSAGIFLYDSQGLQLTGIKAGEVVQRLDLGSKPIDINKMPMVNARTVGKDKDFLSGQVGFAPFDLFDWVKDRPLEVAAKPIPQSAPVVKQPELAKPMEMEPLTIPEEELQSTKSSAAERPIQEAVVHFKVGQKVGAGLTVEPGDKIVYSDLTAPFKVENADKSGFHIVERSGTYTADGGGEVELFGLDRDGQVHIRVVSQR